MASLRQHPKSCYWIACFSLPDGRQTQRSTRIAIKGKDARETADNRREAQRKADLLEDVARKRKTAGQLQRQIADVYQQAYGKALLVESVRGYFDKWLERRKPEVAHTSFLFYGMVVRDFLAWLGERATQDIRTITRDDILAFRNASAERISARSVNHLLKTVRMVFKTARREGVLVENPAEFVDTLPQERSERRPFTEAELRALLSVADDEWRSLILFGLYIGQRLGDLAALTWQNLDLERSEVRLVTGKTGRRQIIPMHPALRRHVDTLPAGDDPHAPLHPRAFAVVAQQNKSGQLSRQFRELMGHAGLAPKEKHRKTGDADAFRGKRRTSEISFHALRYTLTSYLQSAGVGQAVSQEIVGHDSEAIHAVYTRINRDTLAGAIATLPDVTAAEAAPAAGAPKTSATAKAFADFPAAFDYCRETNKPATVTVKGEAWRVFPSGRAERVPAAVAPGKGATAKVKP